MIEVSEGYLSFVENGKRNPSLRVIGAIYALTKGEVGPDAFPPKKIYRDKPIMSYSSFSESHIPRPAMNMRRKDDDEIERLPIPLDGTTRTRLAKFGRAIGQHPADAAGALLRDLLADDEFWNSAERARMN